MVYIDMDFSLWDYNKRLNYNFMVPGYSKDAC